MRFFSVGTSYGRGDLEGYKQAIASYERAIELQPDYAAAYAALSLTLWNLRNAGGPDHTDRIRSTAYRAVQLDPALAEAHAPWASLAWTTGSGNALSRRSLRRWT